MRRGPLPVLVFGVALLSFSITWLVSQSVVPPAVPAHGELQPSQPETTTSLHASTDVEPALPPSLWHLTISARPAAAVLSLDGVPLSDNPFSASVGADHQLHTIRASGSGLAPQERVVTFDRDHAISLELEPRVARSGSAARRPARKAQVPGNASPERVPNPGEAAGVARQSARVSDMFDAPLLVGKTPRPIYEDDPYPKSP